VVAALRGIRSVSEAGDAARGEGSERGGEEAAAAHGIYDLRLMTYDLEIAVSAVVECFFDKRMGAEE
jgi:hypothetical protein